MKVIILAAGIGRRMGRLGKDVPKCLFTINGETLLKIKLDILENLGICQEDIFVVVGEEGECWSKKNIEKIKGISNNLVFNSQNITFEQGFSFFKGIENVEEDDLLVMDGDLLLDKQVMEKMILNRANSILLVKNPKTEKPAGNKVVLGENNQVSKITREEVQGEYTIYLGAFLIKKKDFETCKKEIKEQCFYKSDLGFFLNELSEKISINIFVNDENSFNLNKPEDFKQVTLKF